MPGNTPSRSTPDTQTSKLPQKNTCPCQHQVTTNWNIHWLPSTETIKFKKPFNGNTYTMVKAMEVCLRQVVGGATPPISILAGRWWSPLSSNFTITLLNDPTLTLSGNTMRQFPSPLAQTFSTLSPMRDSLALPLQASQFTDTRTDHCRLVRSF
jgi:hypothetical protein